MRAATTLLFTDPAVAALPFAREPGGKVYRDSKLKGFVCKVGLKSKLLVFQRELREGATRQMVYKRLGDPAHVKIDEARASALEELARITRLAKPETRAGTTLAEAWAELLQALTKDGKHSPRTIADYSQKWKSHLEPTFGKAALRDIARPDVVRFHTRLTKEVGPYAANGCCRLGHAIFRYAALGMEIPGLPALNPFRSYRLFNKEEARQTGLGERDLPGLLKQILAINNPVHREYWVALLLMGLRRSDVEAIQWRHVHLDEYYVELPEPTKNRRPFLYPISTPLRACLLRAKRAGKLVAEAQGKTWVFPSESSASGHIEEPKKDITGHSPHAVRHTFRGMCTGAKIDKLHSKLLMHHSVSDDVHDAYATPGALLDQLRGASEDVAAYIGRHLPGMPWSDLERRLKADEKAQR